VTAVTSVTASVAFGLLKTTVDKLTQFTNKTESYLTQQQLIQMKINIILIPLKTNDLALSN